MPSSSGGGTSWIVTIGYLLFFVVLMYLLIFLPQRRRDKKAKELLGGLKVGDKVVTIGGVSGKVVNIKDDDISVETSIEKTQVVFKKWAIKEVEKPIES
jgi:preprotein translocase subunit YajC